MIFPTIGSFSNHWKLFEQDGLGKPEGIGDEKGN